MSTGITIHPKTHGEKTKLTTGLSQGVSWDNANAITLEFDDTSISVFHLPDVTADLLHRVAAMSDEQRVELLTAAVAIEEAAA